MFKDIAEEFGVITAWMEKDYSRGFCGTVVGIQSHNAARPQYAFDVCRALPYFRTKKLQENSKRHFQTPKQHWLHIRADPGSTPRLK